MSLRSVFIIAEAKKPIVLPVEEFKQLLQAKKLRQAGLYEIDRKQIYYVDVPKDHFYHRRPFVRTDIP